MTLETKKIDRRLQRWEATRINASHRLPGELVLA